MSASVESIQVGRPRFFNTEGDHETSWSSAIIKIEVSGPVAVGVKGIDGDQQADLIHHGGLDKAVLVYSSAHYPFWSNRYPACAFPAGAFGENLTVSGIEESTCCLGDIFEIGSCLLEVSQPRQPCWKLSRRWGLPRLAYEVQNLRKTGWYMRVLREGVVESGNAMSLKERPNPDFTVAWALDVMYAKPRNPSDGARLAALPALARSWQKTLSSRANPEQPARENERLLGQ